MSKSAEKKLAGRKNIFTNDHSETLSIKVPSKEKERIKQVILALRKPFEIKK